MRISEIFESFVDLGKMSSQQLSKGQKLNPDDNDNFREVNGRVFFNVVNTIKNNDANRLNPKGLNELTTYDIKNYQHMRCFLGKNNSSGYCIKQNGELVSVFSSQSSSGLAIISDAILHGARRLNCFAQRDYQGRISGFLYNLYRRAGFIIDNNLNVGIPGEPYSIVNGISDFVHNGKIDPTNQTVVVFMIR